MLQKKVEIEHTSELPEQNANYLQPLGKTVQQLCCKAKKS